jgi:putative ABC transport system substrate-binding protein
MVKKIIAVVWLFGFALATFCLAETRQPKKVPRIGFLIPVSYALYASRIEALRQGLHDLGYVEGQKIVIEYRFAEGKLDRLPELATELVQLKVDCIVTAGTPATLAAKQATSTIPIVMGQAGDPVEEGFIVSLARPGGNITGLTDITSDLAGKRVELLKETIPKLHRVGVLWTAGPPGSSQWEESGRAARKLGLQLQSMELGKGQHLENLFEAAVNVGTGGLAVVSTPLLVANQQRIQTLATKHRLPTIWAFREYTEAGGLMAYGPILADMYRRAAIFVDKIIKGTKPADLPVEQPTKFELVINLNTAKQIGLTIPPNVLARADKVIM